MYLYMVDLQHGEELVEAGTQNGDGGGLKHRAAAWRRATAMEGSKQGVIGSINGLGDWNPHKYDLNWIFSIEHFLSDLVSNTDNVIIVGDFNIHVGTENESLNTAFNIIFTEKVEEPAHSGQHTLD